MTRLGSAETGGKALASFFPSMLSNALQISDLPRLDRGDVENFGDVGIKTGQRGIQHPFHQSPLRSSENERALLPFSVVAPSSESSSSSELEQ